MKRLWSVLAGGAGAVMTLAIIFFAVNHSQLASGSTLLTAGASGPAPQPTALTHYGPEDGALTATLVSPDNLSFHVVGVQRGASKWLFHIHVHNNASHGMPFLDVSTSHYFVLSGKGAPGVPYTFSQLTLMLTAPRPADSAAHPALPLSIAAGGDVDGWLVADLSSFKYPPVQLMYVYGTVSGMACTNPDDQSTCHPTTGYRTLVWQL